MSSPLSQKKVEAVEKLGKIYGNSEQRETENEQEMNKFLKRNPIPDVRLLCQDDASKKAFLRTISMKHSELCCLAKFWQKFGTAGINSFR